MGTPPSPSLRLAPLLLEEDGEIRFGYVAEEGGM